MNYTTIEQSKRLLELGLNLETADMVYIKHATSSNLEFRFDDDVPPMVLGKTSFSKLDVPALPCWSVGALLDLMPISIDNDDFFLVIEKDESYDPDLVCRNCDGWM